MIRQDFPDEVLTRKKFFPIDGVAALRCLLATRNSQLATRIEELSFFDHPPNLLQRFNVNVAQSAVVVGTDVNAEDVAVFDGAEVIVIYLLSVRAEVVMFGERIEPERAALVLGQNRVGELGNQIFVVRRGLMVVPGAGGVV